MVDPLEPVLWCIKHRPRTWDDFIGQDSVISQLRSYVKSRMFPNMIFYGPSGTGKTTAANLYARLILGDEFEGNLKSLNVRDLWSITVAKAKRSIQALAKVDRSERSELDEYMSQVYQEAKSALKIRGSSRAPNRSQLLQAAIRMFASTYTFGERTVKILILDEADALAGKMQQALRRTMEIYSDVTRFILITTTLAGWSPAILSRSLTLRFTSPPHGIVEDYVTTIASRENVSIDGKAVRAIARESHGNIRRAINLLQIAAAGTSHVTEDTVYEVSEVPIVRDVREMVSLAIAGSFEKSRMILRNLIAGEGYPPVEISLEIHRDLVRRPISPDLLALMLDRLAEINYRMTQAKNPFIQLTALLASLCEFGIIEMEEIV